MPSRRTRVWSSAERGPAGRSPWPRRRRPTAAPAGWPGGHAAIAVPETRASASSRSQPLSCAASGASRRAALPAERAGRPGRAAPSQTRATSLSAVALRDWSPVWSGAAVIVIGSSKRVSSRKRRAAATESSTSSSEGLESGEFHEIRAAQESSQQRLVVARQIGSSIRGTPRSSALRRADRTGFPGTSARSRTARRRSCRSRWRRHGTGQEGASVVPARHRRRCGPCA